MDVRSQITEGFAPLVDLVYPPRCPICGDAIGRHGGLCLDCWGALHIPSEPSCASCGRPFGNQALGVETHCAPCLQAPPKHSGISSGTIYNDASRKLILALKHGGKLGLAPMLARLIAAKLPKQLADTEPPLLIPVPLHRWRLWSRGFNQAAILARELSKLGKGQLLVDGLVRRKQTPSLGGLGRKQRAKALRGAIVINPRRAADIRGRDIVLVDDVLTSGATTEACVGVLGRGGARSVRIACFARVLDEIERRDRTVPKPESETPEA